MLLMMMLRRLVTLPLPRPVCLSPFPRLYSVDSYRGPKAPREWIQVKKAKKRAKKLMERKEKGSRPLLLPPIVTPKGAKRRHVCENLWDRCCFFVWCFSFFLLLPFFFVFVTSSNAKPIV